MVTRDDVEKRARLQAGGHLVEIDDVRRVALDGACLIFGKVAVPLAMRTRAGRR